MLYYPKITSKIKKLNRCLSGVVNYYKYKPKKILFDHIPKCAGTSVGLIIEKNYPFWRIFNLNGSSPQKSIIKFNSISNKNRYWAIKGHLAGLLREYLDDNYLCVTVLREPIARIISHYYYAKRTKDHYLYDLINKNDLSLKEYVNLDITVTTELKNYYVQYFSGLEYNKVMKKPNYALKKSLSNIQAYNLVGFQDELDIFIDKLQNLIGLNLTHIPKANVTKESKKIDEDSLLAISKANELDVYFYKECEKLFKQH